MSPSTRECGSIGPGTSRLVWPIACVFSLINKAGLRLTLFPGAGLRPGKRQKPCRLQEGFAPAFGLRGGLGVDPPLFDLPILVDSRFCPQIVKLKGGIGRGEPDEAQQKA